MEYQILPGQQNYTKRWVSYLDLLGFTHLVITSSFIDMILFYEKVIERLKKSGLTKKIEIIWFSDTFLLYSSDDTGCSFFDIECATRIIIDQYISHGIPVRGAMSCGDFCADRKTNTFFGPAFIEAYHYGENQNWIGFVLTPSTVSQLDAIHYHLSRVNYSYWDIPYKKAVYCASAHKDTRILQKSLPAYIIGNHSRSGVGNNNKCLDKLREMRDNLEDDKSIRKYENTINFIEEKQMKLGKD